MGGIYHVSGLWRQPLVLYEVMLCPVGKRPADERVLTELIDAANFQLRVTRSR